MQYFHWVQVIAACTLVSNWSKLNRPHLIIPVRSEFVSNEPINRCDQDLCKSPDLSSWVLLTQVYQTPLDLDPADDTHFLISQLHRHNHRLDLFRRRFRFIQQKLESAPVQEREAVFQVFKSLLFDFSNCLIMWPEIWSSSGTATFLPFPHDWCVRKLCYSGNTPYNDKMLKKTQ